MRNSFGLLSPAIAVLLSGFCSPGLCQSPGLSVTVTVQRGEDRGQNFGSLFEIASDDHELVIGAGFPALYNTRYRADRHALQFFVRPRNVARTPVTIRLPRPNSLCGTYLYSRDQHVFSTFGGVRVWNESTGQWREMPAEGGTEETMRVGHGILKFGDSRVRYEDRTILEPPERGSYQLFFYADGHLCFYYVNRGDAGYRPYTNDEDGFSRLYACPWTPLDERVDLSRAVVLTLPVVGETTFAWGQHAGRIFTGSNIGGFYVFEDGHWQMQREPQLNVSYQLYSSMTYFDQVLMGQYPTGRLFAYDGRQLTDRSGWPPVAPGVSPSAREAQTTVIYGGEMFVGVWPWGELWKYHPDREEWSLVQRMFDHPQPSASVIHPYDEENRGDPVSNLWGQRVTSLVPAGGNLLVSTSAKSPTEWDPARYPFLAPDKWESYGSVYQVTLPGHLSVPTQWTEGATTLKFEIRDGSMSVIQDGRALGSVRLTDELSALFQSDAEFRVLSWGDGIYGRFSGPSIEGTMRR